MEPNPSWEGSAWHLLFHLLLCLVVKPLPATKPWCELCSQQPDFVSHCLLRAPRNWYDSYCAFILRSVSWAPGPARGWRSLVVSLLIVKVSGLHTKSRPFTARCPASVQRQWLQYLRSRLFQPLFGAVKLKPKETSQYEEATLSITKLKSDALCTGDKRMQEVSDTATTLDIPDHSFPNLTFAWSHLSVVLSLFSGVRSL